MDKDNQTMLQQVQAIATEIDSRMREDYIVELVERYHVRPSVFAQIYTHVCANNPHRMMLFMLAVEAELIGSEVFEAVRTSVNTPRLNIDWNELAKGLNDQGASIRWKKAWGSDEPVQEKYLEKIGEHILTNMAEQMLEITGGNLESNRIMTSLIKIYHTIDPDTAIGPYALLQFCQDYSFVGTHFKDLYENLCKSEPAKFIAVARGLQLRILDSSLRGNFFTDRVIENFDWTFLAKRLKAELKNFDIRKLLEGDLPQTAICIGIFPISVGQLQNMLLAAENLEGTNGREFVTDKHIHYESVDSNSGQVLASLTAVSTPGGESSIVTVRFNNTWLKTSIQEVYSQMPRPLVTYQPV